jgi:mono/diheme cytochrome c family protein
MNRQFLRRAAECTAYWAAIAHGVIACAAITWGPVAMAGDSVPAGVSNPQRAWQNWTLNCQGCHRPDGSGSAGTAPPLAGTVSKFLNVPGGREYLGRVPGVATSPLSSADLADLMNWMFWRFDKEHLPADFKPFTAEEIARLRTSPLRLEAAPMRAALLQKADAAHPE